jgi:hypothetical protein
MDEEVLCKKALMPCAAKNIKRKTTMLKRASQLRKTKTRKNSA